MPLDQLPNTGRNYPSMEKLLNSFIVAGYIFTVMTMIIGYGVIFMSSFFLDATPVVNIDSHKVDHTKSKIWEGMPKDEYQKIKYVEEQKYKYENDEPAFDPNAPSSFNLFEGGNENVEY
ncbi:hypothetical protein ASG65_20810 [Bacillus sp. Leaf13]|nr:hypothetical protein ASG65_20810 [Bacillus sp. Leaf13]